MVNMMTGCITNTASLQFGKMSQNMLEKMTVNEISDGKPREQKINA